MDPIHENPLPPLPTKDEVQRAVGRIISDRFYHLYLVYILEPVYSILYNRLITTGYLPDDMHMIYLQAKEALALALRDALHDFVVACRTWLDNQYFGIIEALFYINPRRLIPYLKEMYPEYNFDEWSTEEIKKFVDEKGYSFSKYVGTKVWDELHKDEIFVNIENLKNDIEDLLKKFTITDEWIHDAIILLHIAKSTQHHGGYLYEYLLMDEEDFDFLSNMGEEAFKLARRLGLY